MFSGKSTIDCSGIDNHKESVAACLRLHQARRAKTEVRRFGMTTAELLRLHEWLSHAACTHVAMESTSVYWKPVFNLLEGELRGSLGQCAPHEGRAGLADRYEGLHGSRTSSRMGSSEASSRRHRSATCAISRDIGRASSGIGSRPPTVCTSCWRRPTSSSRTWSQTCWASRAVPCWTRLSPEKPIWSVWRSWRRASLIRLIPFVSGIHQTETDHRGIGSG